MEIELVISLQVHGCNGCIWLAALFSMVLILFVLFVSGQGTVTVKPWIRPRVAHHWGQEEGNECTGFQKTPFLLIAIKPWNRSNQKS